MDIENAYVAHERHPRGLATWQTDPIHEFVVEFWRQPLVPDDPEQQKTRMWSETAAYSITNATDVYEVIAWADEEAQRLASAYSLYAIVRFNESVGSVWIGGINPTMPTENFMRYLPPGANPVSGTWDDVRRHADDENS